MLRYSALTWLQLGLVHLLIVAQVNFLDKPGQHPRELNPYWRDGGEGLPSTETNRSAAVSATSKNREKSSSLSDRKSLSGDGGHSWLLRAYKRVLEQAKDSGRSVEEIAVERWGSLEKLHSLLRSAGIDPDSPDAPARNRRGREYLYSRTRRLDEDRDRRSVRDFDRRRDRERREGRNGGMGRGVSRGEHKSDREREGEDGEGRRRRDRRSLRDEKKREEGDVERRKRDWREGFQKARPRDSSGSESGFLKPGELDQGSHSSSTGMGAGPVTSHSASGQGWRKKKLVNDTTEKPMDTTPPDPSPSVSSQPSEPPPGNSPDRVAVVHSAPRPPQVAMSDEPVTEARLNSLGAKLMKAELMGDSGKIEKLKQELERLRELKNFQESAGTGAPEMPAKEEKTLILTKTDRFGQEKPVQFPSTSKGYRPPSKGPTHSKKGKREKYFHDDDRYSLKELVEQERMMTAEETHAAIARMASKFVPASGSDETVDDVVESKSGMRFDEAKEMDKAKKRSVMESRKMADVVDKCQLCFDNTAFNKHLLIAVGMNTYLCAPWHTSLTDGHCYIVPMEHVTCSLYLDENVWSEVEIFRKGLTQMFADRKLDVVFMETYTSVKRRTHMYIDVIPIPREEGELAPMYFKKAILESDEEWAQNKKLVDTKEKGVRGSLPRGLPYFFAEFGTDGGFGHVIEDPDQFPHYFGREVIGGLLDLNPRLWLKSRREDFDKQKAKVLQLSEWWAPYDWTQKLKNS